ncbi:MAG: AraC family transcriptional regulator [Saprospiraceae bacterium]|nr:AraC family transcriptional regulator [Saprospiraceae bacterium]
MQQIPIRALSAIEDSQRGIDDFSIRDLGPLLKEADLVQGLHRHDFYYLLVVEKGRGAHEIDFKAYPVQDHTVFVMRPGQVHQHSLTRGSTAHIIAFSQWQEKVTQQLLRKAYTANYYAFSTSEFERVQALTVYIWQEMQQKSMGYKTVLKGMLEALFVELIRKQGQSSGPQSFSYEQQRLEEFVALLQLHIQTFKQVAQYATMMNLSVYQLNTITKSTLGKTPSTLINDHILLEAKRYLLATPNRVNQIAQYLGYEDVSYFIRFFKKQTGFTPVAYRQNSL